jgi:hypothetical protein
LKCPNCGGTVFYFATVVTNVRGLGDGMTFKCMDSEVNRTALQCYECPDVQLVDFYGLWLAVAVPVEREKWVKNDRVRRVHAGDSQTFADTFNS